MMEASANGNKALRFWVVRLTCFTCSGFEIPKPTATGFVVACSDENRSLGIEALKTVSWDWKAIDRKEFTLTDLFNFL